MADETKDGAAVGSEPELVDVEIDGQIIKVDKRAVDGLKKKEHDLSSRNERILSDERAKIAAEKAEFREKFRKDTEAYNQLLAKGVKDLSRYDPLTLDGSGKYLGEISDDVDPDVTPMRKPTNTFAENELTSVRDEVKTLKTILANREKAEAQEAIAYMDEMQSKRFKYADPDAVLADMDAYHKQYGRRPSESKIVEFLKHRHDRIATKLPAGTGKEEPVETLPDTRRGKSPEREKPENLPPLNDVDAWRKLGEDWGKNR